MAVSGLIRILDKRVYVARGEHSFKHHPTTQLGLPLNTMKFYSVIAFAALAFAAEDLSSPNRSPELQPRKIGGACKHSVSQKRASSPTEIVLTTLQGTPGTCQKTGTCRKDLGWYSDGDCPNGR